MVSSGIIEGLIASELFSFLAGEELQKLISSLVACLGKGCEQPITRWKLTSS